MQNVHIEITPITLSLNCALEEGIEKCNRNPSTASQASCGFASRKENTVRHGKYWAFLRKIWNVK